MHKRSIVGMHMASVGPGKFEGLIERAGVSESWVRCNLTRSAVAYWLRADAARRCRIVFDLEAIPQVFVGSNVHTLVELAGEPLTHWRTHVACRRGGQRIDGEFLEALGTVLPLWRTPSTMKGSHVR